MRLAHQLFSLCTISLFLCSLTHASEISRLEKAYEILLAEKADLILDTYRFPEVEDDGKESTKNLGLGFLTATLAGFQALPTTSYGASAVIEDISLSVEGGKKYFARTAHGTTGIVDRFKKYNVWRWLGINYTASVTLTTMAYFWVLAGQNFLWDPDGLGVNDPSSTESQVSFTIANVGALAHIQFTRVKRGRTAWLLVGPGLAASYLGTQSVLGLMSEEPKEEDKTGFLDPENFRSPTDQNPIIQRTARALRIHKNPRSVARLKESYREWEAAGKEGDWVSKIVDETTLDGEPLVDPLQLEALQKATAFSLQAFEAVATGKVQLPEEEIPLREKIRADIGFIEANQRRLEGLARKHPSSALEKRLLDSQRTLRRAKVIVADLI